MRPCSPRADDPAATAPSPPFLPLPTSRAAVSERRVGARDRYATVSPPSARCWLAHGQMYTRSTEMARAVRRPSWPMANTLASETAGARRCRHVEHGVVGRAAASSCVLYGTLWRNRRLCACFSQHPITSPCAQGTALTLPTTATTVLPARLPPRSAALVVVPLFLDHDPCIFECLAAALAVCSVNDSSLHQAPLFHYSALAAPLGHWPLPASWPFAHWQCRTPAVLRRMTNKSRGGILKVTYWLQGSISRRRRAIFRMCYVSKLGATQSPQLSFYIQIHSSLYHALIVMCVPCSRRCVVRSEHFVPGTRQLPPTHSPGSRALPSSARNAGVLWGWSAHLGATCTDSGARGGPAGAGRGWAAATRSGRGSATSSPSSGGRCRGTARPVAGSNTGSH